MAKAGPADDKASGGESLTALMSEKSYSQTYVILDNKKKAEGYEGNESLFKCGQWCYRGTVQFNGLKVVLKELPVLIAALQKQQGTLRYYCNSSAVPEESYFYKPMKFCTEASNFFGAQMSSRETEEELEKLSRELPGINDDAAVTFFELSLESTPSFLDDVKIIASKTYVRGLIIISVYTEGTLYFMIQPGEGDQALLDVRFPDITRKGQGMHLASYSSQPYTKLTLWVMLDGGGVNDVVSAKELPKIKTLSVSSKNYQQTYVILKSAWEGAVPQLSVHHDVLFRFGSWCYAGRVQLIPSLSLGDLPFVIPALRMQQSRLEYLCDTSNVPTTSTFAGALDFIQKHEGIIEQLIEESSETLTALIERLNRMGVGEAVSSWLEGDPKNSFFEFKMHPDDKMLSAFNAVELVASKSYHASGIITTLIMYQYTIYVCLSDGSAENPLLDSSFPDIAGKGRGYQIQAYSEGLPEWPTLRKVSVWQTVSALEQEFNSRAALIAQGKGPLSVSVSAGEMTDVASAMGKEVEEPLERKGDKKELDIVSASREPELDVPLKAEEKVSGAFTESSSALSKQSGNAVKEVAVVSSEKAAEEKEPNFGGTEGVQSSSLDAADDGNVSANANASATSASPAPMGRGSLSSSLSDDMSGQFSSSRSGGGSGLGSGSGGGLGGGGGGLGGRMARPHHLPKMESLSRKLDEIKRSMGDDGEAAPWDAVSGRPILGGSKK